MKLEEMKKEEEKFDLKISKIMEEEENKLERIQKKFEELIKH